MQKRLLVLTVLSILVLAGCNMPLTPVPGRTPGATPPTGNGTPTEAVPNTGGAQTPQVAAAQHGKYGAILVDGSGRTLYMFEQDGLNTPTCYDTCAKIWPPLITGSGGIIAGPGVTASLIGTVIRNGGRRQVVYDGHPLYYFSRDNAPGEIKGEGNRNLWFLLSPGGSAIPK